MEQQALISFALALTGAVVLAVWQHGRRDSRRPAERSAHGVAAGFLVLLASAPVTWAWFLILGDEHLPVERPVSPGGVGCSDSEPIDALTALVVVAIFYALVRGIPFAIGFAVGYLRNQRGARRPLPDGHLALRVTGYAAAVMCVLALARLALGGAEPTDYATFGAITVDGGARGWRADWAIDRVSTGDLEPMVDGEPIASESEYVPSTYRGDFPLPIPTDHYDNAPGAKIWIGGRPMLVEVADGGPPYLRAVERRTGFPPERRAHFVTRPEVAPARGGWVLVERLPDDARFAVLIDDDGGERPARVRDAGLLLAPPLWPLVAALPLVLLVGGLARWPGDPDRPLRYLASAWLLAEVAILVFCAYRVYI